MPHIIFRSSSGMPLLAPEGMRLLLPTLLLAGFAQAAISDELRIGVGSFSGDVADPIHGGVGMATYQVPVFDFLVSFDREMRIVPALAESWAVSEDQRRYRFSLRQDVLWHDGEKFTAHDVVHHFTVRLREGTAPYIAPFLRRLDRLEALDDYTVEFALDAAWPDFLAHLTPGNTSLGAITPKHLTKRIGSARFSELPTGTGPWRMVERVRGARFVFEAVEHPFRPRPGFDRMVVQLVPEESTRIAMLRRGDLDLIEIGPDSIEWLRARGFQILGIQDSFMTFVAFIGVWEEEAERRGLPTRLENVAVREALSRAIDRAAIVTYLLRGAGEPAGLFPLFNGGFGWNAELSEAALVPYDPEGARQLLESQGLGEGFRLKLFASPLPGLPWSGVLAEVIADYWRRIGVTVDIVTSEIGATLPIFYGRPPEALGSAMIYRTTRSVFPIGLIQNYVVAEGRAQFAFIDWPMEHAELDAQLEPGRREEAYQSFLGRWNDTRTLLPLFYMDITFAARPGLSGWRPVRGWPSLGLSLEYLQPDAAPDGAPASSSLH